MKIGQKTMRGITRQPWHLFGAIVWVLLFYFSCDTIYTLKNPTTHEEWIQQDFTYGRVKIGGSILGFTEVGLSVIIYPDTPMAVYTDSLHVWRGKDLLEFDIQDEGTTTDQKILFVNEGQRKNIIYNHNFYPPFEFGDRLTLYAKNYIRVGEETFDIDTVQFEFTKLTEPSP